MTHYVNASPAKRFFVEMLVRDIRLEDAIIDLVDNAIDSLIRLQQIDLDTLVTHTDNGAIPFSRPPLCRNQHTKRFRERRRQLRRHRH